MNGWLIAALTALGLVALFGLGSAVGRLFVVDPYPEDQDEQERFEDLKRALGGAR